jgi:predicted transposase YdaD
MHDFWCTDPNDMYYRTLAERTRYFKEDEGGQKTMCKIMEDMCNEENIKTARQLLDMGILTPEQIAQATRLSLETVKSLMKEVEKP